MGKSKKIYIAIFSIITYFSLSYVYSNVIKKEDTGYIYLLNNDIDKGSNIKKENLTLVKVYKHNITDYSIYDIESLINNEKYVLKSNFFKNSVLKKEDFILKNEFKLLNENYEYITININSSNSNVYNNISKNMLVNIYFTGQESKSSNILNQMSGENVISSERQDAYVTVRILEKIKVLDTFNKEGISIDKNKSTSGSVAVNANNSVNSIMIEVKKEDALRIRNLEKNGEFSLSIIG